MTKKEIVESIRFIVEEQIEHLEDKEEILKYQKVLQEMIDGCIQNTDVMV